MADESVDYFSDATFHIPDQTMSILPAQDDLSYPSDMHKSGPYEVAVSATDMWSQEHSLPQAGPFGSIMPSEYFPMSIFPDRNTSKVSIAMTNPFPPARGSESGPIGSHIASTLPSLRSEDSGSSMESSTMDRSSRTSKSSSISRDRSSIDLHNRRTSQSPASRYSSPSSRVSPSMNEKLVGKLRKEDKFLLLWRSELVMPWKQIVEEFRRQFRRKLGISALQMRYKRLKDRLGRVAEVEQEDAIEQAHLEWKKKKWRFMAEKASEISSTCQFTPDELMRRYYDIKTRRAIAKSAVQMADPTPHQKSIAAAASADAEGSGDEPLSPVSSADEANYFQNNEARMDGVAYGRS